MWGFKSRDTQLVRQILSGRTQRFDELVTRHLPSVYAVALSRSGNHADAEDISQEAFLQAYTKLDTLREPGKFAGWVSTIARNRANTLTARRQRERDVLQDLKSEPGHAFTEKADGELQDLLLLKLENLDDTPREVLLLHYYSGKPTKEIADLLNTTQAAVLKRLQRARETLGHELIREVSRTQADAQAWKDTASKIAKGVAATTAGWQVSGLGAMGVASAGGLLGVKALAAGAVIVVTASTIIVAGGEHRGNAVTISEAASLPITSIALASVTDDSGTTQSPKTFTPGEDSPVDSKETRDSTSTESDTALATSDKTDPVVSIYELDGTLWRGTMDFGGNISEYFFEMTATSNSFQLVMQNEGWFRFSGVMSGNQMELTALIKEDSDQPAIVAGMLTGKFEPGFTKSEAIGRMSYPNEISLKAQFELVSQDDRSRKELLDKYTDEAKQLFSAIRRYVNQKGDMPSELGDVAKEGFVTEDAITKTEIRNIRYFKNKRIHSSSIYLDDFQGLPWDFNEDPDYSIPDQMLDYEKELRRHMIGFPPSFRMLTIEHTDVNIIFDVDFYGGVHQRITNGTTPSEQKRRQLNASCANYLKQLGLSIKMFENESRGEFIPAGFAMIYPEYLVDLNILTCPSQAYGKESYTFLYPASKNEYWQELYETVTGHVPPNTYSAGSMVPMVMETHECSGLKGRNVLYTDGHVEFIKDDEWEARMGPWLEHSYK